MTKYLIISLVIILVFIVSILIFRPKSQPSTPNQPINTTLPIQIKSTEEQIKEQAEADRNAGLKQEEINKNYPWLDKLPIQTNNYFVYFDTDSKFFIGKLYPKNSSTTSINTQVSNFKKEIIAKLNSLEIDTSKYTFNWKILPK